MPDPKVSVIIPAYNEEECIEDCVDEVCEVLDRFGDAYEVIVVDDGSIDSTFEHLRTLKARYPQLRAIRFERNCGETAGWDAGFRHARGEFVVTLDADLQNDPADIPRMLALMNEWDAVGGVRAVRNDSLLRRISSRIANWVRNKLTHENVQDVGCTLRVIRAEYVKRVKLFKGMHRFMPTLLALEGCRVTEIPVNHRPRLRGKSKYGVWNRLFRGLLDLFAVRWMISRHIDYKIKQEL
jgi:dolichol-phosphate mannosyltransferase